MERIEWSDKFVVGVPRIDEQHRQLVDSVNRLIDVPDGVDEQLYVQDVIIEMLGHAMYHLRDEEAMLERHAYPDLDHHKHGHGDFVSRLSGWAHRSEARSQPSREQLLEYLVPWIHEHIFAEDMAYKNYFLARGIELTTL